jgi:hypothetical protein
VHRSQTDLSTEQTENLNAAIAERQYDAAAHELERILGSKLDAALTNMMTPPTPDLPTIHRSLANVAWPAIITTNFDNLVPTAFAHCEILTWKDQEAIGRVLKAGTPHVMMSHGALSKPDTIVLSPQAYRESFHNAALQHYMQATLSHHSLLFLGYSLSDYDLKAFLDELRFAFGPAQIPHFALLPNDSLSSLSIQYLRDNFGIETIRYDATPSHPELAEFISLVVDHIPTQQLRNPHRIDELTDLQATRLAMTEDDYHRRFREICIRLGQRGLLRTASAALARELQNTKAKLPLAEQIRSAIAIAKMQLARYDVDLEFQRLREYLPVLTTAPLDATLRLDFEAVVFSVCIEAYLLNEAREALDRAQQIEPGGSRVTEMQGELTVAEFLHSGKFQYMGVPDGAPAQAVWAEFCAYRQPLVDVLRILEEQAATHEGAGRHADAAWLHLKRVELLYANCQDEEALTVFEQIEPFLQHLSPEQRIAAAHNRRFLNILLLKPDYPAASVADNPDTSSERTAHLHDLIEAEAASRERKHYASLPPLWRDLRIAYCEASWGARMRAHRRLAQETLATAWIFEALHHTLLVGYEPPTKTLAAALIVWRNPQLNGEVVKSLMERASLATHVEPAAEILGLVADIIPDDSIASVVTWLLARASQIVATRRAESAAIAIWKAASRIIFRCAQEDLRRILIAARAHRFLREPGFGRAAVSDTLTICARHLTELDSLGLAAAILPLATTQRWDGDLENCLSLLRELARRDENAKALIANTLLPRGTSGVDFRIATLAPDLGREVAPSSITRTVERIVTDLPLQVWQGTGEPPRFALSVMFTHQLAQGEQKVSIAIPGGQSELAFIRAHKHVLPASDWDQVFTTVIKLANHPLNVRTNRVMLTQFLADMIDRASRDQAHLAMDCLRAIINGATSSPADMEATNTTMRFQVRSTTAGELKASALRSSSLVLARFSDLTKEEDIAAFRAEILDANTATRELACHAIQNLSQRPGDLDLLMLTAAQDIDENVAAAALHTIATLYKQRSLSAHHELATVVASRALASSSAVVRQLGTHLAATLLENISDPETRRTLLSILDAAGTDAHFSVRAAARRAVPAQQAEQEDPSLTTGRVT